MRVGVFDSGIGGLTVLKNLYKHYPNNEYIYYGDTLNLPYGSKTKEELEKLASQDVEFLLDKKVDIIVIACGTVSSNCLDYLKKKYNIPIYDIISPTINYLNNSNYSNIGVIATERTIDSNIFKYNIKKEVYQIKTLN
jgi:glutamate racemase